jgi:hypothetical protein
MSKRLIAPLLLLGPVFASSATGQTTTGQTTWYKFSKSFISQHFASDSAFGTLQANKSFPASAPHPVSCGGQDGELHIGVAASDITDQSEEAPVSAMADGSDVFGIVAEPPNVTSAANKNLQALKGQPITFTGYFRVWNEGHDRGATFPSNPHHVLELHPAWGFESGNAKFANPAVIYPMQQYRGYGASKFGPLLTSIMKDQWLRVYEDNEFLYLQLKKADNFYQLPVLVKNIRLVQAGKEALVDVYSGPPTNRLVFPDLTVVTVEGTDIFNKLSVGQRVYLLGFFSVDVKAALSDANGHTSEATSAFAKSALEFFAFGVPRQSAVPSCSANEGR